MSSPGRVTEFGGIGGAKSALLSNFDVGFSNLKKEHKGWLDTGVLNLLRAGGSATLLGFTSRTGTEVYNRRLSDDRTKAVLAYLEAQVQKRFPINIAGRLGLGEVPAGLFGLPNGEEASNWRAVLVSAWKRPTPPPIPTIESPLSCRRTVEASHSGINYWAVVPDGIDKGRLIEQDIRVVPSWQYLTCTSPFERQRSFIVGRGSPIVEGYSGVYSGIVGECVGHYLVGVPKLEMAADLSIANRVLGSNSVSLVRSVPLDAFLNGYYFNGRGEYVEFSRHEIIPLYVSMNPGRNLVTLAHTSEGKGSYDIAVDTDGRIVDVLKAHGQHYPSLRVKL